MRSWPHTSRAIWGLCHGPILTTYLSPGVPFSAPSLVPSTLTLSLVTFGSFLWIYTTMITAAIKARLWLRVTDAKSI